MKRIMALLLALTMVFALCACGSTPAAAPAAEAPAAEAPAAAEEAPAAEAPAAEAKRTDLNIQFQTEPSTLDFQADQTSARTIITQNLFASLLTYDNDGKIIGEVAEDWSYSDDFTEWTFVIKSGAKFSDGSDLTVDDVVYSMNRGMEIAFVPEFAQIASCEAISDSEVKFVLNAPNTLFDRTISGDGFCVLSKAYMESGADLTKEAAITSGAYYLDEWVAGSEMILKANEYYVNGAPAIKEVHCVFIPDNNTAIVALESGQVDFITNSLTLSASEYETVATFDNVQFVPLDTANYVSLCWNFQTPYFGDKNVRKAINLAVNREYICAILGGMGVPAGTIPAGLPSIGGYLPGYDVPAGDIEAAKAALAESAFPDGFTFAISCTAKYLPVVESLQAQLKDLNIVVEIDQCPDFATVVEKYTSGNFDAGIGGYTSVTGDIGAFAGLYTPATCNNWDRDNTYGDMIVAANSVVGAEREAILKEAYDIIDDTVPYLGLYFGKGYYACDADLDFGVNTVTKNCLIGTMSWK